MSSESAHTEKRDLLSHTSILIMTAFLCGLLAARVASGVLQNYLFYITAFGLVAYLGLGWAARIKRYRAARTACKNAISRLEQRMEDHVRNLQDDDEECYEERDLSVAS